MANYIFETATDTSSFTSTDHLIFASAAASMVGATDTPAFNDALGNHAESITLTVGDHSETFSALALRTAAGLDRIVFLNGDSLVVGTGADNNFVLSGGGHGHGTVVYGFDGDDTVSGTSAANDTINGGAGDDRISGSSSHTDATGHFVENDYYLGGAGNDTIVGGDGNDHIYGNVAIGAAGLADGADSIVAGDGNDYVNGNAGNDTIYGEDGNDRLYGGSGDDAIGGGNGNDSLQGNRGLDSISGGDGNDTLHGGQDRDELHGDDGNDQLWGDAGDFDHLYGGDGNDTLHGGTGYDYLQGDAGNDVFAFAAGEADNKTVIADDSDGADNIADFTHGSDHISLGFTVSAVLHNLAGTVADDGEAAMAYAQQLLSGSTGTHGTEVAAISDHFGTWLFWDDTHSSATINSAIYLEGITDSSVITAGNHSDFI